MLDGPNQIPSVINAGKMTSAIIPNVWRLLIKAIRFWIYVPILGCCVFLCSYGIEFYTALLTGHSNS